MAAPNPISSAKTPVEAQAGFHDIKPLPQFAPLNLTILAIILGAVVLALLLWYFHRKSKRRQAPPPPPPPPPERVALAELRILNERRKTKQVDIREFAACLSLTLRHYLETVLEFPAEEATFTEFVRIFPPQIKKALPMLPQDKYSDFSRTSEHVLRFCQRAAFSDYAEENYPLESAAVDGIVTETEELIRTLAHFLGKEAERTRGVIAAGALKTAQGG